MLNLNRHDHASQAAYALTCRARGEPLTPEERQVIEVVHRHRDDPAAPDASGSPRARARFAALRMRNDPALPRSLVLNVQHFPLEDRARVQVLSTGESNCMLSVEPGARPGAVRMEDAAVLQGPEDDIDVWVLSDEADGPRAEGMEDGLRDWMAAAPRAPVPRYALNPSFPREAFDPAWRRAWDAADPRADRPSGGALAALLPLAMQTLSEDLGHDPVTAAAYAQRVALHAATLNHVQESSLPLAAQERIGVARFPVAIDMPAEFVPDAEYGIGFCRQTHALAAQLRQGELQSFDEIWGACRDWRAARAIAALAGVGSSTPVSASFSIGREGQSVGLATPIVGRYAYVADRLIGTSGTQVSTVRESVTLGGKRVCMELQLHERAGMLDLGDGPPVELTRLKVWSQGDGSAPPQLPGYPRARPGTRGIMEHTTPPELARAYPEAERRVAAILASTGRSPQALLPDLGRLHWLVTHMAPDSRGSAAKAELAVRALALAKGWELPPFREGFVPDLEAFLCDEDSFAQGYADAFESPPVPVSMPVMPPGESASR